jgi:hypothetical protein
MVRGHFRSAANRPHGHHSASDGPDTRRLPLLPGNAWSLELKPPTQVLRQVSNAETFHGEIGQTGTPAGRARTLRARRLGSLGAGRQLSLQLHQESSRCRSLERPARRCVPIAIE